MFINDSVVAGTEVASDVAVIAAGTFVEVPDAEPKPMQELVLVETPINPPVAELPAVVVETVQEAPVVVQRAAKSSKSKKPAAKKTAPTEPEVRKTITKKIVKSEVAVEEKKPQRGRPIVYFGARKKHIVTLIRHNGITGSMAILNADVTSKDAAEVELANKRSLKLVPEGLGITAPTLGKFAKEAGIVLHRGRPAIKKTLKKAA